MTAVKQNRRIFLYEICSIHISVAEDSGTSGCDAVSLVEWSLAPRRNIVPSSSRVKQSNNSKLLIFWRRRQYISLRLGDRSPNSTASHQRRTESSCFCNLLTF